MELKTYVKQWWELAFFSRLHKRSVNLPSLVKDYIIWGKTVFYETRKYLETKTGDSGMIDMKLNK